MPFPRLTTLSVLLLGAACSGLHPVPEAPPRPEAVAALDAINPHPCSADVAGALAGLGVPAGDVRALAYYEREDRYREKLFGYDLWITLKDQPGSLNLVLDEFCRPRQAYTQGGARVSGVEAW